ncbi:uroporphyrinogen-III synthase, partial [Klebsiella pneumoniae]|nr:uroporphyrinogen-III synthase [Klebsiella pneumoniae]
GLVIFVVSFIFFFFLVLFFSLFFLNLDDLKHIQWIAVGQATANRLHDYGIEAHVPEVETSEGMLNLPLLHHMQKSGSVAFWRGEGGRQFMMETLQQQGI